MKINWTWSLPLEIKRIVRSQFGDKFQGVRYIGLHLNIILVWNFNETLTKKRIKEDSRVLSCHWVDGLSLRFWLPSKATKAPNPILLKQPQNMIENPPSTICPSTGKSSRSVDWWTQCKASFPLGIAATEVSSDQMTASQKSEPFPFISSESFSLFASSRID